MAAEKTKVVGILVQPFHGTDYDISKKSEECWILKYVYVKLNPDFHRKRGIQREESFRQQIGLKFKDQTSETQHLEHRWNIDT